MRENAEHIRWFKDVKTEDIESAYDRLCKECRRDAAVALCVTLCRPSNII